MELPRRAEADHGDQVAPDTQLGEQPAAVERAMLRGRTGHGDAEPGDLGAVQHEGEPGVGHVRAGVRAADETAQDGACRVGALRDGGVPVVGPEPSSAPVPVDGDRPGGEQAGRAGNGEAVVDVDAAAGAGCGGRGAVRDDREVGLQGRPAREAHGDAARVLGHRLDPTAEMGVEVLLVALGDGARDRGPERPREREPGAGDEVDGRAALGEPGGGLGTDEPGAEHGDRAPRGIGAEQGTQPLGVPCGVQVHHAGLPAVGARERRHAVHGRAGPRDRARREDDGGGGELAPVREDDGPPRGVQAGRARPHELDVGRHG